MTTIDKEKKAKQSEFSKFFRNASPAKKKKVYLEVAKKAAQEQRDYMKLPKEYLKREKALQRKMDEAIDNL